MPSGNNTTASAQTIDRNKNTAVAANPTIQGLRRSIHLTSFIELFTLMKKIVKRRKHRAEVSAIQERLDQAEEEAGPSEPRKARQKFQPCFVQALVKCKV